MKKTEKTEGERPSGIVRMERVIKIGAWIAGFLVLASGIAGILLESKMAAVLSGIFIVICVWLSGYFVVQQPEVALIERFGRYVRKRSAGLRWRFPIIEIIRKTPRTWEQPVPILQDNMQIDFKDGAVQGIGPVVYCQIEEDKAETLIYKLKDWVSWVQDNLNPLIRGYLNNLYSTEAIDEGMARGNLFERIAGASQFFQEKINAIDQAIGDLRGKGEEFKPLVDALQKERREEEQAIRTIGRVQADIVKMKEEAKENGIKLPRAVIPDFKLSEDMEQARERIIEERREREAARWKAEREAVMRTEPILQMRAKLIDGGFRPEEATRVSIELEVLETLAEKGIWTAGLGQAIATAAPVLAKAMKEVKTM